MSSSEYAAVTDPMMQTIRSAQTPTDGPDSTTPIDIIELPQELDAEQYALPSAGDVIGGNYRVVGELSRGAMGVVLSAFDEKLRRSVAIKVIRSELLRPGFVRQFLNEAQAMAQVNHPHVVAIYALGEFRAAPYFVMERIEGETLASWLARQIEPMRTFSDGSALTSTFADPRGFETRLRILNEVCAGVEAIHAVGAVHRDLKPSNILVDHRLHCRVGDFGLSTLGEAQFSEVAGTLAYMAPELTLRLGEYQPAHAVSDVYSLGCIAYELLTGQHPHQEHGRISGIRHVRAVVPPSLLRSDLPTGIDRVILAALHDDPERRTATVGAFLRELLEVQTVRPDRILIAEDDADFRELLRETLCQRFPKADIHCVENGAAALASVDEHPAAVALIDLQMPTLDGASLTSALRSRPHAANMPIIVLTGSGGAAEWKRLSSLGADRFLVKPVNLDDVVSIIEHVMRERRAN
jgi:eukaryotic-like serine/threonine-protein kinase